MYAAYGLCCSHDVRPLGVVDINWFFAPLEIFYFLFASNRKLPSCKGIGLWYWITHHYLWKIEKSITFTIVFHFGKQNQPHHCVNLATVETENNFACQRIDIWSGVIRIQLHIDVLLGTNETKHPEYCSVQIRSGVVVSFSQNLIHT